MSTETPAPEAPKVEQPAEQPKDDQKSPAQETDWKAEARKWEARAKENTEAAKRLQEIEDAQKSEAEKAAERMAQLEKDAATARSEALRLKVAIKHGISDEDADLFLTGSDEETLTKQAERLAARYEDAGKPRQPKPDRNQGRQSGGSTSTADQFAAAVGDLI